MKLLAKKRTVIFVIIGFLFVLSLNFWQREVKGFFYFISSPIQKSFWKAGDDISDFLEGFFAAKSVKRELENLKVQNQELLKEVVALRNLKEENQFLREAVETGLPKEFRLVMAGIIGKEIGQDSILIDLGEKDGLIKGLPVVTQQKVLVGKIVKTHDDFSEVMLISNQKSSFDAAISESDIAGIIKGKGNLELSLDLIPQEKEVKAGDLIISTQTGGIYPKGLLVGFVKEIKKSDIKPFQEIEVLPFFEIAELENIFILLND